jgi:hypothetical protein
MKKAPVALLAFLSLIAGCGGNGKTETPPTPQAGAASDPLDLRGVCPSTIVVQTSWLPDALIAGPLYSLLGPDPIVDADKKLVTGSLVAQGKDTGVKLEIRAGGPAIGYTQTSAQMYLDTDITLGLPHLDEQIQLSATQPTLSVLSLVDIDPQMILWDPVKHPNFTSIADIGKAGTKVLYFEGDTYMEYLVGSGILKRDQLDSSYDGSPSRFIASGGEVAQSGYATVDLYALEKEVKQWRKPVKYQLVYQTGYPNYGELLAIRTGDKDKLAPCLRKLVPVVQQAQVDVAAKPAQVIDFTVKLNEQYKAGGFASKAGAEYAANVAKSLHLVGNGNDKIIGNFEESRVQRMIDITKPIFAAAKKPVREGLTPSDIYTNEFVKPIGLS